MLLQLRDIGGKKSMNRIHKAFENKKAFIGFLTAGDPVLDKTVDYILDMEQAGASLIEIGIPFSDPIAEGPTIQEANVRALKNKVTTDDVFEMVKKVREKSDIPLCFMTYLNVVFKDVCYNYDVTLISMIAPTSKDRVEMIAKDAKGFIYLVSSMGVTGTREDTSFANNLEEIINHIHQVTDTPVAIGFGINKPEQVKEFKQYADGVIVGSAIVNIIKEHGAKADEPLKEYIQLLTNEL